MLMEPAEMLGLVAAALVVISWLPQLAKSHLTKSTKDFSWAMIAIMAASQALWLLYGLMIGSVPVALTNFFTTIFLFYLGYLKFRHG